MEKRDFCSREISLLGFGLMRLPLKEGTREIDYDKAKEMVDYAYKNGVNYFDTAWGYHDGGSEPFAKAALSRYKRESYYLASKLPIWLLKKEEDVDYYFNEQLKRCGVDYFDNYLVHAIGDDSWPAVGKYKVYEQLLKKKQEGKIKALGFSFHSTPELLTEIVETYKWDFAQIQLNYLDWEFQDAKTQYNILNDRNIPVVVMEPIRGGSLVSLNKKADDMLKKAAPNASAASWALRFCGGLSGVKTILSGMSTMDHVIDNVNTMTGFAPLSKEEHAVITAAVEAYRKVGAIPCTGCRYCMDCPQGVDIPLNFGIYNDYKTRKAPSSFVGNYKLMGEAKQAKSCISCNQCTEKCPQNIDIPAKLSTVARSAVRIEKSKKK